MELLNHDHQGFCCSEEKKLEKYPSEEKKLEKYPSEEKKLEKYPSEEKFVQKRSINLSFTPMKKTKVLHYDQSTKSHTQSATRIVKLRRSNGKVVQGCDVYIGRRFTMGGWNLQESKWANPFKIKDYGSAEAVVEKYRDYLMKKPELLACLPDLKGKVLGCWCKPGVCHGDILVELANKL